MKQVSFLVLGGLLLLNVWASIVLIDPLVYQWAQYRAPETTAFFHAITDWGKSDWILIPTGAVLLIFGALHARQTHPRVHAAFHHILGFAGFIFLAVAGSGLLVQFFKQIVGRARPKLIETLGSVDFTPLAFDPDFASFPSGHTATAFSFALAIALIWPRLRWPALGFAIIIGLSRVIVSAHYFTDVVVGALAGVAFTVWLYNAFRDRGWLFYKFAPSFREIAAGHTPAQRKNKRGVRTLRWFFLKDGWRGTRFAADDAREAPHGAMADRLTESRTREADQKKSKTR